MSNKSYSDEQKRIIESKIASLPAFVDGFREINICGMPVWNNKHVSLVVIYGWMHGVWRKYGQKKSPAFGLNMHILDLAAYDKRPVLILDGRTMEVYVVNCRNALKCYSEYVEGRGRGGVAIVAIPKISLKRYHDESVQELKQWMEDEEIIQ